MWVSIVGDVLEGQLAIETMGGAVASRRPGIQSVMDKGAGASDGCEAQTGFPLWSTEGLRFIKAV